MMAAIADRPERSHFDREIGRLAHAAREHSARIEERPCPPIPRPRRISPLIWIGVALVLVELLSLAVLYGMRAQERATVGTTANPMLTRSDCDGVRYRTYWKVVEYLRNEGHPPAALSDLVGTYVDELPFDPRTGKTLEYSRHGEGFSLHCPR